MNKIQQMHFDAITKAEWCPKERMPNYVGFAQQCTKLTKKLLLSSVHIVLKIKKN